MPRHRLCEALAQCLSGALTRVWEIAKAQRDAVTCRPSAIDLEPASALRRELDLLPFREDYGAAQARAREIAAALG
jgi:hypothetical protein